MKINFKAFVVFMVVFQIALVGPLSSAQHSYASTNSLTEGMIHQFANNTWASSNLVNSSNGDLYLSHVKSNTEIAVKKWENQSWKDLTSITTSATGDTGFSGPSDIAIDTSNNIHAAFLYYKGTGITSFRGVEYGVFKNGSWSFSTVEGYSDPYGWKNMYNPSVAVDTNGKAHIVYVYNDANEPRKYEIHYATNQSGTWSTKTIAYGISAIDEVKDPQIEVDKNNNIHITFVKEDGQNDYYGNYYYTHKNVNDPEFPPAIKIVDAVSDHKNYWYAPFVVDSAGKLSFSYSDDTNTTYFQTNQSGTWNQEIVNTDTQNDAYPVNVYNLNSKDYLLMYTESPSQWGFFAMVKEGGKWTKGTNVISPNLIEGPPSEMTFAVDSNDNLIAVMEDRNLRKVSYLSGTNEDFGLMLKPPLSNNANLSNLSLSAGTLLPGFSALNTSYNANVGYTEKTIQVTPAVADPTATVAVNGQIVDSGTACPPISLNVGANTILVAVKAQDGTVKTYTVSVQRGAPSNNSDLSNLTVSTGELNPLFTPSTKHYNVRVPNLTDNIRFTPTTVDSNATLIVNGKSVTSGQGSDYISLSPGTNSVPIIVTAQDGFITSTYIVDVNRNRPPAVSDTTFTVDENAPNGTSLGKISASDLDGDSLTYSILSGNTNNVFILNPATGEIKVADSSLLDYEKTTSYTLAIQVSDGMDTSTAFVKINVHDLNDNPPVPKGFTTSIDENSPNGTIVGIVTATDADADSHFTYKIIGGNASGAFAIDSNTGVVTVADSTKLDYETVKSFTLTVQVSDGENTADTIVIINLNNLNDNMPVVKDAIFNVNENAPNGTLVGTVEASDADGDPLTYRIISGNETGAFEIDASSGKIIVADSSQLDYETIKSFMLKVQVSDGIHQVNSVVTINLNNLNDNTPVGKDAAFTIDEKASNGTAVGTVTASDSDGDAIKYSISSGNADGIFTINEVTGVITIANASKLNSAKQDTYKLTITISDGQNAAELNVTIHVLSSEATLSNLTSSQGNLTPDFKPGTIQYSMSVGENTHTIKLTPTVTNATATVKINGKLMVSGQESQEISLNVGKNIITIEVTAQNGQTTTYTITVTRLKGLVPAVPVNNGETVTISDEQVNLVDQNGTLVVDLEKDFDEVKSIRFTSEQLETLINRQAMIKIVKNDVQLLIPAANFKKGEGLIISLERVAVNPEKLPLSNMAASAVYEFTIIQGGKIIHHFDHDIQLVFSTDGDKHPDELKVYYWNIDKKEWEVVGGSYEDGLLKAWTNHFSTFAVFHPNDLAIKKPSDLPNTATNMYNWLFVGILVILLGGAMLIRQRARQKNETN